MSKPICIVNLNDYQKAALITNCYPQGVTGLLSLGLEISSEAGEIAGKLKKLVRDNGGQMSLELRKALVGELGDTLWGIAVLAHYLGFDLSMIATANIEKLASRAERNQLHGSGDNR